MVGQARNQSSKQLLICLGIFCAGLFFFTAGLCYQEVIGFESRFYLFALEMLRHGPTWFPTVNGVPYPDYPATATLLIYAMAKLAGHLDKWVAVLPTATAAALTLVITYLIGSLHDRRWGLLGVLFLLLTITFLSEARTISPDQYITLITALTFYLAHSAHVLKTCRRLYFIPILFLFGFACRGPIGLVIPAAVLCSYYLAEKNIRAFVYSAITSLVLLVLACVILCCIAHHVGGMHMVCDVLHTQVFGRLQDQNTPWYFYFTESLGVYAVTYPLGVLVAGGYFLETKGQNKKDKTFLLQLVSWAAIILVGMSIPESKKIRYVLAFTPALALLCAYLFVKPQKQKFLQSLRDLSYWTLYFLPLLCMAAVLNFEGFVIWHHWHVPILFHYVIAIFLLMQWVSWLCRRDVVKVLAVSAFAAFLFYILVIEPVNLMLNRTHSLVMSVEILRNHNQAQLVFYQENPDGLPIKYLANLPHEVTPVFISTPAELSNYAGRAYFITDRDYFAKIPLDILHKSQIVYTGSIGHDQVVVFEKMG